MTLKKAALLEHKKQNLSFTSYFSPLVNPYLAAPGYLTDVLQRCYLHAPSTHPAVTENAPSLTATEPFPPPDVAHSSRRLPTDEPATAAHGPHFTPQHTVTPSENDAESAMADPIVPASLCSLPRKRRLPIPNVRMGHHILICFTEILKEHIYPFTNKTQWPHHTDLA